MNGGAGTLYILYKRMLCVWVRGAIYFFVLFFASYFINIEKKKKMRKATEMMQNEIKKFDEEKNLDAMCKCLIDSVSMVVI